MMHEYQIEGVVVRSQRPLPSPLRHTIGIELLAEKIRAEADRDEICRIPVFIGDGDLERGSDCVIFNARDW